MRAKPQLRMLVQRRLWSDTSAFTSCKGVMAPCPRPQIKRLTFMTETIGSASSDKMPTTDMTCSTAQRERSRLNQQ